MSVQLIIGDNFDCSIVLILLCSGLVLVSHWHVMHRRLRQIVSGYFTCPRRRVGAPPDQNQ